MTDNEPTEANDDLALAALIHESVDDFRVPRGIVAKLGPAIKARRRYRRRRVFAATTATIVALAVAIAAFTISLCGGIGTNSLPPHILARNQRRTPGAELAAGWTMAGICRTLRRRRRDEVPSDCSSPTTNP